MDKRLNEIDSGSTEMMSREEIMERYPEFWKGFSWGAKDVRIPGGEAGEEVKVRQKSLPGELVKTARMRCCSAMRDISACLYAICLTCRFTKEVRSGWTHAG